MSNPLSAIAKSLVHAAIDAGVTAVRKQYPNELRHLMEELLLQAALIANDLEVPKSEWDELATHHVVELAKTEKLWRNRSTKQG